MAGIDIARALAALIMLQGHATDAWVRAGDQGAFFAASRFAGTFPLPAFLLLAGTSVAWRVALGEARGETAGAIARTLRRRGLRLVAIGYAVSFVFALMDGPSAERFWETVLRADVLHVIGLSIAAAGLLLPKGSKFATRLMKRTLVLGALVTLLSPLLPAFDLPAPFAAPLGLFVDAAPFTRMPFVPLFAWFAAGAACAHFMRGSAESAFSRCAGASPRRLGLLTLVGLGLAVGGWTLMTHLHSSFGGALTRQHIAVVGNVLDLAGRGVLVLALGAAMSPFLPSGLRRHLVLLGRGSLTAYIVHLPFCYGRFGSAGRDALTSAEAALGIVFLALGTYAFVRVWPATKKTFASFFASSPKLR